LITLLGDTLQKIAIEKAGIIKARKPVVVSQYQPEVSSVFSEKARELKSPIQFAGKDYKVTDHKKENNNLFVTVLNKKNNETKTYQLDLTGTYQVKNLLGVIAALNVITENGFIIHDEDIDKGLSNVIKLTGLNGRWQTLSEDPLVICDAGHNEDGIKEVIENLKTYSYKQLHFVLGVVNDKDVSSILKLLPKDAIYYFTKASVPRALPESELKLKGEEFGLKGNTYRTVKEALEAAKANYKTSDLIFAGGSTFVVADVLSS